MDELSGLGPEPSQREPRAQRFVFKYARREQLVSPPTQYILRHHLSSELPRVSDCLKPFFISIPMAGGNAFESSALFEDENLDGHYLGHHQTLSNFKKTEPKFQKFGMVRHPCSRIYSVWQYLSNNKDKEEDAKHFNETTLRTFDAFVDLLFSRGVPFIENENYLRSQVSMIFNADKSLGLDQLLIYERWNESIEKLGHSIGVGKNVLTTITKPEMYQYVCKDIYTTITWSKIRILYEMDFCVLGYSTDILEENVVPSLNLTDDVLNIRYEKCRGQAASKSLMDQSPNYDFSKPSGNGRCRIYTYFQKDFDAKPSATKGHDELLSLWVNAWSLVGWEPKILTEEDAKRHPNYGDLRQKFLTFPTVNAKHYELSCFLRYLAMAAAGGGWMSDYDALPFGSPACTEPLNGGSYTVYNGNVPSLVSGTSQEFTRVANLMADMDWKAHPKLFSFKNRPHVSDMFCHMELIREKLITSINVVISPEKLFEPLILCRKTNGTLPFGLTKTNKPWVVHFSHHSDHVLRKRNSTLLGGQYFNTTGLSHTEFIERAYNLLQKICF